MSCGNFAALSQIRVAQLARHLRDLKRRGLPVGNSYESLERQESERYLITCDQCTPAAIRLCVQRTVPSHTASSPKRRWSGATGGRAASRAFRELAAPEGPGCSCVPYHEVNRMLSLDVRVLFGALDVALKSAAR